MRKATSSDSIIEENEKKKNINERMQSGFQKTDVKRSVLHIRLNLLTPCRFYVG